MGLKEEVCRVVGHDEDIGGSCVRCGASPIDPFWEASKDKKFYRSMVYLVAKYVRMKRAIGQVVSYDYTPPGFEICGFSIHDPEKNKFRHQWYEDVNRCAARLDSSTDRTTPS